MVTKNRTDDERLGKELRRRREEADISLRSMAERIRKPPIYVSEAERGKVQASEDLVVGYARELKCDPDILLLVGGRVSKSLRNIISKHPEEFVALINELKDAPKETISKTVSTIVRDGEW